MDISATMSTLSNPTTATATSQGLKQMGSDDFLKVLITQLQYQDPFKPMSNEEMISQMSQIRSMEMSTTLTDSLKTLTDQQRLGSAATLIGHYVTGTVKGTDGEETTVRGVVRGLRFKSDGEPVLELDSGVSLPLKALTNVTDTSRLIGKYVTGTVTDENGKTTTLSGTVSAVKFSPEGDAWLQLSDGQLLPVAGVTKVTEAPDGSDAGASEASSKDGGLTAKVVLGN